MIENEISNKVIGLALEIHKKLGPGLLESAYKECLYYELIESGFKVEREKPVPLIYKEVKLDHGYRIDLLVNNAFVIELKCVDVINFIHKAQLLTYLRLGDYRLGVLLNFNTVLLKDGITRIINSKK
jgi:GxxExxY protein